MLKLVKSEIHYFRGPLIIVAAFFILMSAFSPIIVKLDRYLPEGHDYLYGLAAWIVVCHMIFAFTHLYYEVKELRVRRFAQLPLGTRSIGLARIAAPVTFFLLAVILILACYGILAVVYPKPVSLLAFARDFFVMPSMTRFGFGLYLLLPVMIWLGLVLIVRFLTEWQGRVLLVTSLGLVFFYSILLKFISYKLVLIIKDLFFAFFNEPMYPIRLLIIAPLVFLILLYVFFMTRRSYANA